MWVYFSFPTASLFRTLCSSFSFFCRACDRRGEDIVHGDEWRAGALQLRDEALIVRLGSRLGVADVNAGRSKDLQVPGRDEAVAAVVAGACGGGRWWRGWFELGCDAR